MIFSINSYVGINSVVTFASNKSGITASIGNFLTDQKKYEEWGMYFNEQYYDPIGLSISYEKNDLPEQFNLHRITNGKIFFLNRNLMDLSYNQVKEFLKTINDKNFVTTDETSRCIYSFKYGFYTYNELSEDSRWMDNDKIAMVGVFRKGMHEDVRK